MNYIFCYKFLTGSVKCMTAMHKKIIKWKLHIPSSWKR